MTLDEVLQAAQEAEVTLRRADDLSARLAELLVGRLRRVRRHSTLEQLKRELKQYNSRTGVWKDRV